MICPLKFSNPKQNDNMNCITEKCAWWKFDRKQCGMHLLIVVASEILALIEAEKTKENERHVKGAIDTPF